MVTFRTSSERNVHILNHFRKTSCSICHQDLVQLGNIWYSQHEHTNHIVIKSEINSDDAEEFKAKSEKLRESDADHFDLLSTKIERDPIDIGVNKAIVDEEETFMYQSELVRLPEYIERELIDTADVPIGDGIASLGIDVSIDEENIGSKKPKRKGGTCKLCNREFVCAVSLKYHMNIHWGLKPFECEVCGKAWADKRNLEKHRKIHQKRTATHNYPQLRKRRTGKPKGTATLTLESENNQLEDKRALTDVTIIEEGGSVAQDHAITKHAPEYNGVCGICDKKFSCRTSLKYHMNIHMGVKPFVCEVCGKAWADKRNLGTHRKIHERSTVCDSQNNVSRKMGRRYRDVSKRKRRSDEAGLLSKDDTIIPKITCHKDENDSMNAVHNLFGSSTAVSLKIEIDPFDCQVDDIEDNGDVSMNVVETALPEYSTTIEAPAIPDLPRSYESFELKPVFITDVATDNENTTLRIDDSTNVENIGSRKSRPKGVTCVLCNKQFVCTNGLKYHMNIHWGLKPFECEVCGKAWADRRNMTAHRRIHEKSKR